MSIWKGAALVAALVGAAGAGAAISPAFGQGSTRVAPRAVQILGGQGSYIGVSIRDVDPTDRAAGRAGGVVIEEVTDDSPAAKAGLRQGDVVVEYDGERVRSARQFTRLVQESVSGRQVQVSALRDGKSTSLTLEPAERDNFRVAGDWARSRVLEDLPFTYTIKPPPVPARPAQPIPTPDIRLWLSGSQLGITVDDLSPQLGEYFGTREGVLVTSVQQDSAAAGAGLKAGDVVTSVNGTSVESASALRRATERLAAGGEFTLGVVRDKKSLTLKGKMEDRRDRRRSFRAVI